MCFVGLALLDIFSAAPVRSALIGKGTVSHPGGVYCSTVPLATFVSGGENVIVIYMDPGGGANLTGIQISPSVPQGKEFVSRNGEFVYVFRGLASGQTYVISRTACGSSDVDYFEIYGDGCLAGPPDPPTSTCELHDSGTGGMVIRFPQTVVGHPIDKTFLVTGSPTAISCPAFSIVAGPANGSMTVRYDPSIDDTVVGELTPDCDGLLLVPTPPVGPSIVVATATDIQRRHLDGSADLVMGTSADRVDLAFQSPYVYLAKASSSGTSDGIYKGDLEGNFVRIVTAVQPWCVEIDPVDGKVYWAAQGLIQRADTNGYSIETLPISYPAGSPTDLVIDPYARRLYWIDVSATNAINSANLDGSDPLTLTTWTGGGNPRLAFDPTAGRVYWTESNPGRIRSVRVDGAHVQTMLTPGITLPVSIGIDVLQNAIYWADAGTNSVHRVQLDGSGHTEIMTGAAGLTGILLLVPPAPAPCSSDALQQTFDELVIGATAPYPGDPAQGGWYQLSAVGDGFSSIQGDVGVSGLALHEGGSGPSAFSTQAIDAKHVMCADLSNRSLITLSADFYGRCWPSNVTSPYAARLAAENGGGFEVIGFGVNSGDGVPRDVRGLDVRLSAFNGADGNDPIPLVVGQGLAWDTWHHVELVLDHSQDTYHSIVVDGQMQSLLGYQPPRGHGAAWERGQQVELLLAGLTIDPWEWPDATTDDVFWDNLVLTLSPAEPTDITEQFSAQPSSSPRVWARENPTRNTMTFLCELAGDGPCRISVYDVAGRRIRDLVDSRLPAGRHQFGWDRRDRQGSRVAAGLYFVRLEGDASRPSKFVLLN